MLEKDIYGIEMWWYNPLEFKLGKINEFQKKAVGRKYEFLAIYKPLPNKFWT